MAGVNSSSASDENRLPARADGLSEPEDDVPALESGMWKSTLWLPDGKAGLPG
jgi:hypothetical protein